MNVTDLDSKSRLTRLELINLNGDLIMELPTVYDPTKPSLYNVSSFLPPPDFFYLKVSYICKGWLTDSNLQSTNLFRFDILLLLELNQIK